MKKILTLILFLCLSACFGGVSPTSQFYTLESVSNVNTLSDKKRSGSSIRLIIPLEIGQCETLPTPIDELKSFIEAGL